MWVPLIEADELEGPGVDHFVRKYLEPLLAAPTPPSGLLLACTHYPLLLPRLRAHVPGEVALLTQGEIVAERLDDWLRRHPEMERRLGRTGARRYVTTDDARWFEERGSRLLGRTISAEAVRLASVDG